ncbi:hypothetical protein TWF696_009533 [Orbilia brochopaga]|uniref:Nudix hydrolase domain-containing protein n=1 Tax=Orbilia brochopaga TaxID=3140254 RepID=A0AAV9UEK1_9PEZI
MLSMPLVRHVPLLSQSWRVGINIDLTFAGRYLRSRSRSLSTKTNSSAASLVLLRYSSVNRRAVVQMAAKKPAVNPHSYTTMQPGGVAPPRPSASLVLLDGQNRILLTHRTSSVGSFADAHVFPGGNLDADDPSPEFCAIRETFEETGVLLTSPPPPQSLTATFGDARRQIHARKTTFSDWLAHHNLTADTAALLPFTTWITPPTMKKRYETKMFLAFLPAANTVDTSSTAQLPTADGGVETVSATFMTAAEILAAHKAHKVILFPPQAYLVTRLAVFTSDRRLSVVQQREGIRAWLESEGMGSWVFEPRQEGMTRDGRRLILGYGPRGDHGSKTVMRFGRNGMPEDLEIVSADAVSRL